MVGKKVSDKKVGGKKIRCGKNIGRKDFGGDKVHEKKFAYDDP